jgi:hypothetical protein
MFDRPGQNVPGGHALVVPGAYCSKMEFHNMTPRSEIKYPT